MSPRLDQLEPRRLLAAGQLDSTFGTGGVAEFNFDPKADEFSYGIVPAPGGKYYVYGFPEDRDEQGTPVRVFLFRINGDGSLDKSFPDGPTFPGISAATVAVDPVSGRVAAVQYGPGAFHSVAVFTPDTGLLDPTFAGNGRVSFPAGGQGADRSTVAFQSDGKLLYASRNGEGAGALLRRFNTDGSLDSGFGNNGVVAIDHDEPAEIAVTPDGKITLLMGTHSDASAALYRFNVNGAPDTSFNGNGVKIVDTGTQLTCVDLDIGADGAIVVLTEKFAIGRTVRRYDANLNEMAAILYSGSTQFLHNVLRAEADPAGGIITVEQERTINDEHMFIVRHASNGLLDPTYGASGRTEVPFSEFRNDFPSAGLVVLDDGTAVAAGSHQGIDQSMNYEVARLQGGQTGETAQLDITLNRKGTLILNTPGSDAHDVRVYIRKSDGRLVVRVDSVARSFDAAKVNRIAIFAGPGSDTITIDAGVNAYVDGGVGDDTINGGAESDVLLGGAGRDQIRGNGGNDRLFGDADPDYLLGGAGRDEEHGGKGNDTVNGGGGNDLLYGDDTPDHLNGGPGNDYLLGGAQIDWLFGDAGNDTLSGAGLGDHLDGGPDADTVLGGPGDDFAKNDDQDTFSSVETLLA